MTDQQQGTTDDFFAGVGGAGAPSFKFAGANTGIKGTVVDQYRTFVTEPGAPGKPGKIKTYQDGTQIPQLNVTLQTELRDWDKISKVPTDPETGQPKPASEDDGKRRIFIKYDMRRAVGVALQAVGETALKTGGTLAVKLVGERETGNVNPLPLYEARYEAPPQNADLFADQGAQSDDPWATSAPATPAASKPVDDEPPF